MIECMADNQSPEIPVSQKGSEVARDTAQGEYTYELDESKIGQPMESREGGIGITQITPDIGELSHEATLATRRLERISESSVLAPWNIDKTMPPEIQQRGSDFQKAYFRYQYYLNLDPSSLSPEDQRNYQEALTVAEETIDNYFREARDRNLLVGLDQNLEQFYIREYRDIKLNPEQVRIQINRNRDESENQLQISNRDEADFWNDLIAVAPATYRPLRTRMEDIRKAFGQEGLMRILNETYRTSGIRIREREVKDWEWKLDNPDRKLWERHEFYHTLRLKKELIANEEDLERAYRQFIRDTLSTGNTTVDRVLGELKPLEDVVTSEANQLGLDGNTVNRKRAEAGGSLLVFASDWFARIGKRKEVQTLMERFTDESTEKVLGLVLSYDGKPLEAGSLLTMNNQEGLIGLDHNSSLYKELQELGVYHPNQLKFIDFYRPDGPHGEFYNDKVKQEKYQDLIKRALVNKLMGGEIVSKDAEGKENKGIKKNNLDLAALGLRGEAYEDVTDREFLQLLSQTPEDIGEINETIEKAMDAYYQISQMETEEKTPGKFTQTELAERQQRKDQLKKAIEPYEKRAGQAKEATNIAIRLLTVFGFSSELLCPRIWKRESIRYEPAEDDDPEAKYIFDEEEGIYVPALKTFKLKNGQIQIDDKTGLPKPEFEYPQGKPRYKRVQGDYVRDSDAHRILISIEDEVRERLGYDANNNNSFFPLDDRSRTVALKTNYPRPGWMREYLEHIDPQDYIRYVPVLPEQRDLMIRKIAEDWRNYIRAHRQLMIDYAQDATEYEGSDLRGTIPEDFVSRYADEHPGIDLSSPGAADALKEDYLRYVKGGFQKEIRAGIYQTPGLFAYQQDILYGGGQPFAIKKDEYLSWWILGDPIQNAQKTQIRSINFVSLLDTATRSVARQYMGGPYFRRFVQGLALKAKDNPIVLDDYETQIWVGKYGGADDARLATQGRPLETGGYQSGFMHSFLDKKEQLKNDAVYQAYETALRDKPNWTVFPKEMQYQLLETMIAVFNRQFSFAAAYLVHNERTGVTEEGKWLATRFMNGVFDLAGSEFGHYAYPDLAYTLFIVLNKARLSEFQNKTVREVLLDLYVKNYK